MTKTSTMNLSIVMLAWKREAKESSILDKELWATKERLPIGYTKPSVNPKIIHMRVTFYRLSRLYL